MALLATRHSAPFASVVASTPNPELAGFVGSALRSIVGNGRILAEIENTDTNMSITFTAEQAMAQHPQFHITPQFGWMNDPNGMFQLGALYHVFFQYNPAAGKDINLHCNAC